MFDLNKKDKYILIAITIFSTILTGYYIIFNNNLGIYCSDVYIYLLNALYYTGKNINSTATIYLSPVICFLTAIFMEIGIKDALAIRIVTGLFAISGNIGIYLLFRERFNELLSLTGSILYATFALNLTWLANGSIDIPSVAVSIWMMYFAVLAIKKDPKYYPALFALTVIGIFTRYIVIFMLGVLLLYYVYNKGIKIEKEDLKYIIKGVIIALLIAAIIMIPIHIMSNGDFGVNGQIIGGISGKQGSSIDQAYNLDLSYYLFNYLNFISSSNTIFINSTPALENPTILSFIVALLVIIGIILWTKKTNLKLDKEKLLPITILLIAIITYTHISSFITMVLVLIGLYLLGKDSDNKTGLTMLSWILLYFIFLSYLSIKVNRYIIPTIPPFIYLLLASIELIHEKIKINNKIIPISLIILFIIQGFAFSLTFEETSTFIEPEYMSDYIINEVPDFENHRIGVYNMRPYHWFIGENITGIETGEVEAIDSADIDYYISNIKINDLKNFSEIKNIGELYLYKKSS